MNYIFSKKKPEVGDRGFIIGNRFIPIQKEISVDKYPANGLIALIDKNNIDRDGVHGGSTIRNVESLRFNGTNQYLIDRYNFNNYSNFSIALKFKVKSNGIFFSMTDSNNVGSNVISYTPTLSYNDGKLYFGIWDGSHGNTHEFTNVKDYNIAIICSTTSSYKLILNSESFTNNRKYDVTWCNQCVLGCGWLKVNPIDVNWPTHYGFNNPGWNFNTCEINYFCYYDHFLSDEEIAMFQ